MSTTTSAGTSQPLVLAEWVKLFPRQVCETYTSSVTFMKQLTVVALSMIMYLKNMFPIENYRNEYFGGLKLTILKKQCKDDLAQFVSTALTQAFEAFDKKYLHQLALCYYDSEYNVSEYHVFEYTYKGEEVIMDFHSKSNDNVTRSTRYTLDNVRERTIAMIRACVVLSQTFPEQRPSDVSLRLYYNEDAPEGYQAPGFVAPLPDETEDPLESGSTEEVAIGWVDTPFHNLRVNCYIPDRIGYSNEANASQNAPAMTQNESENLCSGGVELGHTSEGDATRIQCSCNKYFIGEEIMLTCKYCGTQQHASCYGVSRAAGRRARHCCLRCSDADAARAPADAELARLPHKQGEETIVKYERMAANIARAVVGDFAALLLVSHGRNSFVSLCVFRLALSRCATLVRVSVSQLAADLRLSSRSAASLFGVLQKQGVLLPGEDLLDSPREIDQEKLKHLINKYLPYSEETNMVDRLVAESLSQGSQPDPVGDVLGAMEKINLQNATTMGNTVEYTQKHTPDSVVEDSTLKQYREAILSSNQQMDEELQLSGIRPEKNVKKIGKKTTKRKMDDSKNRQLMSELKTKKAKAMPE